MFSKRTHTARHLRSLALALLAAVLCLPASAADQPPSGAGSYEDLVVLLDEFLAWRDPRGDHPRQIIRDTAGQPIEPIPDWRPATIAAQREELAAFQARLADMNVAAWPRDRQVDWLAVRSRFDQYGFILQLQRPWARDPGFYVDRMLRVTFANLPVSGEAQETLLARLRAIPVLVAEAQNNLDDVAADYADLAIFNLSNSDGVGHGYPYRPIPPAGVIGWYADFRSRAAEDQPELLPAIDAAQAAVRDFDGWLKERRPGWTATAGAGKEAFDWYLRYVKLMPWTSDELVVLGERELDRLWAIYGLERHRNRNLPELEPAANAMDYQERIRSTDARVRAFLDEQSIITVPEDIGELDTNVPWIVRPGGRNFWEEVQFRDPSPDHVHAVIPGHRFDGVMASRQDHPIRSKIYSGARVEGWATYLEEALLQAGLFEDLPRTRELIQIFGIFRAARVPADVWLQNGEKTAQEVVDYWLEVVPYLDENVARVDAEIYLRRPPGYGVGYTIGMLQMQRLLGDRTRQLGDDFDLKTFHDDFLAAGRLPLSLIRWDMTGLDDEVRHFWDRTPMPVPATAASSVSAR